MNKQLLEWFGWFRSQPEHFEKPWLMFGKGPTFASRRIHDLGEYNLLGLNHVVQQQAVAVSHVIDIEVITEVPRQKWRNGTGQLVMPWHPHHKNNPSPLTLCDWCEKIPVLLELAESGRLCWYNCLTAQRFNLSIPNGSPIVGVRWFSSEAALNLLAAGGVKQVRTLGIDGGNRYAYDFSDLTPLENGRTSFDAQFHELRHIQTVNKLDFAPL